MWKTSIKNVIDVYDLDMKYKVLHIEFISYQICKVIITFNEHTFNEIVRDYTVKWYVSIFIIMKLCVIIR